MTEMYYHMLLGHIGLYDEGKKLHSMKEVADFIHTHDCGYKLKLFFKWGIQFEDKPFVVPLRDNQNIKYANKDDLMTAAHEKYQKPAAKDDEEIPPNSYAVEQTEHEQNYPESEKNARRPQDVKIHRADTTETNA